MNKSALDILKSIGAIITNDHFVYTSGKHGSVYVRKDMLYPHTKLTSDVCMIFAEKSKELDTDIVVGPSIGGIILSQWVAYHLSKIKNTEILGVFTEKDVNDNQVFKRGYDELIKGKNVLVVEDMTTTGGSVAKVVESVKKAGGTVLRVCVMINRSPANAKVNEKTVGAPYVALDELPTEVYDAANCPLCEKNIPVNTTVGHGKKFLESKNK
jgi:orotate phosphoribosyltransferase